MALSNLHQGFNNIVSALMEIKNALGVIVAAPTAGSCGGLPGAIVGAADAMGCDEKEIAKFSKTLGPYVKTCQLLPVCSIPLFLSVVI